MSLEAKVFGRFQLLSGTGQEVEIANRRARALLAMLLLQPDEPLERDQICKLLWPGRFEAQARASLRQCLLTLGKVLDELNCEFLDVSRSRIAVNAQKVRSDLSDLEGALDDKCWAKATELVAIIDGKPILDQMSFGEAFENWLSERRQVIEQRLQSKISEALASLKASNKLAEHNRLLDRWMVRHPAKSRAFLADLHSGRTRIAVLPFASQDNEDAEGYFADGIVDELITTLGQVPQLLVAGRTSSFQFRDTAHTLPQIADLLHVSHLIEGSVERQGEIVRMNVRLIDGQTGFESWSYSYNGTIDDILATREGVAKTVTRELGSALNLEIAAPVVRRMTSNKQAYGLYLQGRALTRRAIGDGVLPKAIELLQQALEIDPNFADCWTALAEAHVYTAVYTPCLDKLGEAERMAECARKAIALSPEQGHARAMLGIHQWIRNDAVGALDLAYDAYRLEPENPSVTSRLGSFLLYCGRTKEALPYIEAAIDQDPVDGRNYGFLCVAQLNLGNIDAAMQAGQRSADLGTPPMHWSVATRASGDNERAVEQYYSGRLLLNTVIFPPAGTQPMGPEAMDAYWQIAAKGVNSGREADRQQYCQMLEMLHAAFPDPGDPTIVWPAVWMGFAPMVFKTLGKQITPPNMVGLMALWADIEPIRQTRLHPEFLEFATRIGLVAAWEKYGWPDLIPAPQA